jgi:hypothetical protein
VGKTWATVGSFVGFGSDPQANTNTITAAEIILGCVIDG